MTQSPHREPAKGRARRQADQALVASPSSPQAVLTEGFDPSRLEFRPGHDGEFDELVATFDDGGVFIETMNDQGVYIDFQWDDGLHCQLWVTCGGKAKLRYYHEHGLGDPPRFTAKGVDRRPDLPRPIIDIPRAGPKDIAQ